MLCSLNLLIFSEEKHLKSTAQKGFSGVQPGVCLRMNSLLHRCTYLLELPAHLRRGSGKLLLICDRRF